MYFFVATAEGHPPIPLLARKGPLQVSRKTIDLPGKVHIAQNLVHQLLQLRPLAGCHRREHRRGGRHPSGKLFEELVEVLRITREQLTVLLHELLETRVQRCSRRALFHHRVQGIEGIADALTLGGTRCGRRAGQLVEVGLHGLGAQALQELVEAPARLIGGEGVVREAAHTTRQVLGEQPELCAVLAHDLVGDLSAPLVA